MPIKKKYAPKAKMIRRKVYGRRRRNPTSLVNRALSPIPQRYITKLKYSEVITTGVSFGDYQMSLNSIFKPSSSGTGHQPYGFDQLAILYNRYRVISCGYRLNLAVGASTVPIVVSAMPANVPVTALTSSEIRENPRAKYITQNPGAAAVVLSNKTYIPSLVGRSKAQYMADDRYQATVISSPDELAVLNIQTFLGSGNVAVGTQVQVLMEYTVEFFDIKSLGQSS